MSTDRRFSTPGEEYRRWLRLGKTNQVEIILKHRGQTVGSAYLDEIRVVKLNQGKNKGEPYPVLVVPRRSVGLED
jgi:hypothetical protein